MKVTSRKLSQLEPPVWSAYAGLSVLYDNPGCAAVSGLQPLEALPTARPDGQDLYDRLATVAGQIASSTHDGSAQVGLLPRPTYHVTLCDGVNEGSRAHVRAEAHREVVETLAGLPDSLLWANGLLRLLRAGELCWQVWTHPIRLRVEALQVWGHAFVARLEPADEPSAAAMDHHEAGRRELAAALQARVGVEPPAWRPHLTLGYVPNDDAASRLREHVLPAWQPHVAERTADVAITFRSASLYGFTDMIHFWRLGH